MLKYKIAKLEDVDESVRGFYKPADGGGFLLQVEGTKTQQDVDNVQTALQRERALHKDTGDKLKVATDSLAAFGELTPDKVKEQAEQLETLKAAGTPELAKNFEKIVNERVGVLKETAIKQATAVLEKKVTDLTTQLTATTTENGTLKLDNRNRTIDDAVRSAAGAAKVMDGAVVDALMRARGFFDIADDGKVITKDGKTPSDWIEERKKDAGHWWPVAKGAGAHGSDGNGNFNVNDKDNPWTNTGWNFTKQGAIVRESPDKAARLAEQAGSKVGATTPPPKA